MVWRTLDDLSIGIVVTKAEDDKLGKMKFGQAMPVELDGEDILARYKVAKISGA